MAQDGCGSCLGKFWLWQSQRVPPGPTFRRHLSLRICWTALRRIHDPSIMWRPAGVFISKVYCSVQSILPFRIFLRYSRRLKVSKHNQPEFSPSTEKLLKTCDPTTFPTLPCGINTPHLTYQPQPPPPSKHTNTFPYSPTPRPCPLWAGNPFCPRE